MLEQEIASIIKYTLDKADNPSPYYWNIPQDFVVPAVYFPIPELDTDGDTFVSYLVSYTLFIMFFHKTTQEAYAMALDVITALKNDRNLVPLIDTSGNPTVNGIRIKDPAINSADDGAVRIKISWDSRRAYDTKECSKMQGYHIDGFDKAGIYSQRLIPDDIVSRFLKNEEV